MKYILDYLLLGVFSVSFSSCVVLPKQHINTESQPEARQLSSFDDGASLSRNVPLLEFGAQPTARIFKRAQRARRWTEEEERLLLALREQRKSWDEIADYFPERTWRALQARYLKLTRDPSMPKKSRKKAVKWTPKEEELLIELRDGRGLSWNEIDQHFPGRGWSALESKYYYLKRGRPAPETVLDESWTPEEYDQLMTLKKEGKSWREIAEAMPGHSQRSLERRYRSLTRTTRRTPAPTKMGLKDFTTEEDELLLELGKTDMAWKERAKRFDGRSIASLKSRYLRLLPPDQPQSRKWTRQEEERLIEAVKSDMTLAEIAEQIGRTYEVVRKRVRKLQKSNRIDPELKRKGRRYTAAEIKRLYEMVERGMRWDDIAKEFPGRTVESLQGKYKQYQKAREREERGW